ncbi:MAG: pantothenate kinase [Zetaproteobacteria bacterium CG_4_9_14_3_um_filter_49_83]|nr:MAG: pantothenate kinase [Zetaproteobacteria bacterium CG17_big_fil_post_rev_8_21_14_2_50_50_13]PIV30611.1 MAG: pantothenate kinase [Zetaproteobacteria bacterium CG02_land_8_20_14_3_00_50_9]PIY56970.1 MAG: pantothenate kinase [Zetaproteobacteria bacterium CG_4_10_14_0_8_um_filter_49_80]PJA34637.1 MAG: pantothenate kinase [Zetaproteobacteria bacterium CG_4_9_14_3_um_filter_49_83]
MKQNFLCVDVGNTHMVFGLYRQGNLQMDWRLSSQREMTSDELAWQLYGLFTRLEVSPTDIDGIMIASVVPHLDQVLADACQQVCQQQAAFVGSPEVKTAMAVDYKNPREVGADRIANAVAARKFFGAPVIVLDCGTATTFDVVSAQGHYAGGLIVPGLEVSLQALSKRAARLPEVSFGPIDTIIGRDTVTSMQAGVYWSNVEGLSGIVRRLRALPDYANAPVIATGGFASIIAGGMDCIHSVEPHLTLQGLNLLATMNIK